MDVDRNSRKTSEMIEIVVNKNGSIVWFDLTSDFIVKPKKITNEQFETLTAIKKVVLKIIMLKKENKQVFLAYFVNIS